MNAAPSSPPPRLHFIDELRGFAIAIVVLGHALQYTLIAPDGNPVYRFIYSFHMPLFMFISGFVYSGAKRGIGDEARLKSRTLLLPFLAWLPATFIWIQLGPAPLDPRAFIARVVASPDAGGLWFLWVLFLINLMIILGRTLLPSRPLIAASAFWVVLNALVLARPQSNLLGIKLLCWHFPFFLAGLLFRRHNAARYLGPAVALACAVLFLLLEQNWSRTNTSAGMRGISVVVLRGFNYLTAFSAIFALYKLFSSVSMGPLKPALQYLGRVSLEIYATHIYFVAAAVFATGAGELSDATRVCIACLIGLTGALVSTWAIKRWQPLALLMFGQIRPTHDSVTFVGRT